MRFDTQPQPKQPWYQEDRQQPTRRELTESEQRELEERVRLAHEQADEWRRKTRL